MFNHFIILLLYLREIKIELSLFTRLINFENRKINYILNLYYNLEESVFTTILEIVNQIKKFFKICFINFKILYKKFKINCIIQTSCT